MEIKFDKNLLELWVLCLYNKAVVSYQETGKNYEEVEGTLKIVKIANSCYHHLFDDVMCLKELVLNLDPESALFAMEDLSKYAYVIIEALNSKEGYISDREKYYQEVESWIKDCAFYDGLTIDRNELINMIVALNIAYNDRWFIHRDAYNRLYLVTKDTHELIDHKDFIYRKLVEVIGE